MMVKHSVTASILAASIVVGALIALHAPQPQAVSVIEWLPNAKPLPKFTLASTVGAYNNESLSGRWTIVVFGYLQCPDVCPTALLEMTNLAEQAQLQFANQTLEFVFISVDPKRDNLADLKRYVSHFNPSFIGATGAESQIAALAKRLGIRYKVADSGDDYTVAHSVTFSLIDHHGQFFGRFYPGIDPSLLAKAIKTKLSERELAID